MSGSWCCWSTSAPGGGPGHYQGARALLEARGFTVTAEHLVNDAAAQLPVLLPQILAARPPLLVVGSGDGTIAAVVDPSRTPTRCSATCR